MHIIIFDRIYTGLKKAGMIGIDGKEWYGGQRSGSARDRQRVCIW